MANKRLKVGIIGLEPDRSWGAIAHLPALRALAQDFEVTGVANSSRASGEKAAKALGIPRAFDSADELVNSRDVDVVAVTVKVPHHYTLTTAALNAGKHVYCEWPLGNGLKEGRDLAALARLKGTCAVAGTQALFAPEVLHVRELIAQGYLGELQSTTLVGTGATWGPVTLQPNAYTLDRSNGATMLTIAVGHTLAALVDLLGPIAELSAVTATRRKSVLNVDTGETLPMTAEDQILVSGTLESGAPISIHYRGGMAHGAGLVWDINGSQGDLRVTGPFGHAQLTQLSLSGGSGEDHALQTLPLPAAISADSADGSVVGNVRRVYQAMASDIKNGTRLAPSFDDAVRIHSILAAIERAAITGERVRPNDL